MHNSIMQQKEHRRFQLLMQHIYISSRVKVLLFSYSLLYTLSLPLSFSRLSIYVFPQFFKFHLNTCEYTVDS